MARAASTYRHTDGSTTRSPVRVDAAVGEGGAHDGEVGRGDQEGALPRVDVGGLQRVVRDAAVALQQAGDGLVSLVVGRLGGVHVVVEPSGRPRTRTGRPAQRPLSAAVSPRTRQMVARAPALTSGFIGMPPLSSSAITELNGRPVLFTPTCRGPPRTERVADRREKPNTLETDSIENSCSASPTLWEAPVIETMLGRNCRVAVGQRRDVSATAPRSTPAYRHTRPA